MKSSRSKPFSGKKKKEQLQLKKQIKNQKLRNDLSDDEVSNGPVSTKLKSVENNRRINLRSEWDVMGSGTTNPRQNPEYQTEIEALPDSWRIATFENVYESDSIKLKIPLRPSWDYSLTREELEDSELKYFQSWINSIYDSIPDRSKMSYFEQNLEVWRQLWRVCEISNAVVIVADIRFPVVHLPPSFCEFVIQKLKKPLVIALTKSDLVSPSLRNEWKNILIDKFPNVNVHFVSTFDTSADAKVIKLQKRYTQASGIVELLNDLKSLSNDNSNISKQWDKIISSFKANNEHVTSNNEDSVTTESLFTIGFIGQPNVGKSSLINSIFGRKIVSASRTPGHTKHFQTLHLSAGIRVCDCPGLVFPSIIDRNLQILSGLYNIAQVKDPYGPLLYLAKRIDLFKALKIERAETQANSVFYLCEEYAKKCGFFTSKAGRADTYRAANFLLRQVIDGKIVLYWVPRGYDSKKDIEYEAGNVSDFESQSSSTEDFDDESFVEDAEKECTENFSKIEFETHNPDLIVKSSEMGLLNFEEQLVFYGQYHNNAWNRVIHIIFVPIIFWTYFVWLSMIPIIVIFDRYHFNVSFAITFLYIFYYILLEPVAGAAYAPFLLILTYSANVFAHKTSHAFMISAIIQGISWAAQFFGHYFFERRAPALLDNLFQAFLLAPLFIFMELLFVLGYRPALLKRIRDKTKIAITTYKMGKDRKSD